MNPFEFLQTINLSKEDIMTDDNEKSYNAFLINKGLSQFADTAFIANEMNKNSQLDKRLQYDFLRAIVRKRKRFSKWAKATQHEDLDLIKEVFGYNNQKAYTALSILSPDQIKEIKDSRFEGGALKKGKRKISKL